MGAQRVHGMGCMEREREGHKARNGLGEMGLRRARTSVRPSFHAFSTSTNGTGKARAYVMYTTAAKRTIRRIVGAMSPDGEFTGKLLREKKECRGKRV